MTTKKIHTRNPNQLLIFIVTINITALLIGALLFLKYKAHDNTTLALVSDASDILAANTSTMPSPSTVSITPIVRFEPTLTPTPSILPLEIPAPSSPSAITVTIDYAAQISTGSPLVFGGAHSPGLDRPGAWDAMADAGVTSVRKDLLIESSVPQSITLDMYKQNVNNCANPANWNQMRIKDVNNGFAYAKARGMKTFGVIGYTPAWLTYTGTPQGVPKDWDVYEDIVKKIYAMNRDNLDYVEIWNEPTFSVFLNVAGSGLTVEEAYIRYIYHIAKAIREVDKVSIDQRRVPMGGLVADNPLQVKMLDKILSDSRIQGRLNFISYHNYGYQEPSSVMYKDILAKRGMSTMPLYLTEWNYNSSLVQTNIFNTSNLAIPYTANKFIQLFKQGIMGANYFQLTGVNNPGRPNDGEGYMGFYRWVNGQAILLPQAKSWKLMSKTLGLGKGTSKIVYTDNDSTLGFINTEQVKGFVIVNQTDIPKIELVKLANVSTKLSTMIKVYGASGLLTPVDSIQTQTVNIVNNSGLLFVNIPAQSVVGVTIQDIDPFTNLLNNIVN